MRNGPAHRRPSSAWSLEVGAFEGGRVRCAECSLRASPALSLATCYSSSSRTRPWLVFALCSLAPLVLRTSAPSARSSHARHIACVQYVKMHGPHLCPCALQSIRASPKSGPSVSNFCDAQQPIATLARACSPGRKECVELCVLDKRTQHVQNMPPHRHAYACFICAKLSAVLLFYPSHFAPSHPEDS